VRAQPSAAAYAEALVRCRVAGRSYAFASTDVRFIARTDQVSGAGNDGVARVGTLRGREAIPVYSVAALLHPSADSEGGAHVVVTGSGDQRAGWQVDRILRDDRDTVREPLPLPTLAGPVARRWFSGLFAEEHAEPGLVCFPAGLDPRARNCGAPPDPPPAAALLSSSGGARGVVAIFSSAAAPPCGTARYAIAGHRILALVQSLDTCAVPGTPSYVAGLAVWRGVVIPVLDLSRRTGSPCGRGRHLLVRLGSGSSAAAAALPIDRDVVLHHASAADTAVAHPPGLPAGAHLFAIGFETVALLDLDAVLGTCVAGSLGEG